MTITEAFWNVFSCLLIKAHLVFKFLRVSPFMLSMSPLVKFCTFKGGFSAFLTCVHKTSGLEIVSNFFKALLTVQNCDRRACKCVLEQGRPVQFCRIPSYALASTMLVQEYYSYFDLHSYQLWFLIVMAYCPCPYVRHFPWDTYVNRQKFRQIPFFPLNSSKT